MWSIGTAERLARAVHEGAVDKADQPYIGHVERVVARVIARGATEHQVMAAWLHDVVEDSALTIADLHALDAPVEVVRLVNELTKDDGQSRREYIQAMSDEAWEIKEHGDTADNTEPERLGALDPLTRTRLVAKYERDRQFRAALAG